MHKTKRTFLGVPMLRIDKVSRGLYGGPPMLGHYHMARNCGN